MKKEALTLCEKYGVEMQMVKRVRGPSGSTTNLIKKAYECYRENKKEVS
jgi:hypothetical protein